MKITISGLPGSGTTTVAKILAEKLGYKLISAGEVFRELARKRNMSLGDFSKYAEKNPEIDRMVDELQKKLAENERDAIIEGRLSGWFVDAELKVWIYCDAELRFERIAKRENRDIEDVRRETKEREELERRRYMKFYGIDINDLSIYDIAINSKSFSAEEIANLIIKVSEMMKSR